MRIGRSLLVLSFVILCASRSLAQVSCIDPDNLCTGNPCTMTNVTVQSPCVVDFGARALVIGGAIIVPDGGTLSLTADSIVQQGRIEGRNNDGASVSLIAANGDVDCRTEIDVSGITANGSIAVQASGNVMVKSRLTAKTFGNGAAPGGSITLDADGEVSTGVSAVIDVRGTQLSPGGTVTILGDTGVTTAGRMFAEGNPGGNVQIISNAGTVTLDRDVRASGDHAPGGSVSLTGETGVVMNDDIRVRARNIGNGGSVNLTSGSGNVTINDAIQAQGIAMGGSVNIDAPMGTASPRSIKAPGKTNGGSIGISAANIEILHNIDVQGSTGDGGSIQLAVTGLLHVLGGDLDADGKVNGGILGLYADVASGDITVDHSTLTAVGTGDFGGSLVISAPAGTVDVFLSARLSGRNTGGDAQVEGAAVTVRAKSFFDVDGHTQAGEIRFNQSGAGLMEIDGTLEARESGKIEALAPAGSLTARGRYKAASAGCIGLSAGGTLNTSAVIADVPLTANCP